MLYKPLFAVLALFAAPALAATDPIAEGLAAANKNPIQIYANTYGCVWDGSTSHDVMPCINAAATKAAITPGAVVVVPAGSYYAATNLSVNASGVVIQGAGYGFPRDNAVSSSIQTVTKITYNGTAEAGPFIEFKATGAQGLYGNGLIGIGIDCGSLVDTCVHLQSVSYGTWAFTQGEARKTGVLWDTATPAPGNQQNDAWIGTRNINASYAASGLVLDNGSGSSWNTSYNRFHYIGVFYGTGDGLVLGNDDTNRIDEIYAYKYGTATTGSPVVCANTAYTPPSGVATNGHCYDNLIGLTGAPVWSQGFVQGATFVVTGGNAGTLAYNPVSLATNAASDYTTSALNFASVSGVTIGQTVSCGGVSGGIYPETYVTAVTATTVSLARNPIYAGGINGVASGQTCTFGIGINPSAAPGVYTITAATSTTFNIAAPAGGNSQSGIAVSGGAINFKDMIIPVTGTAVTGDTYTVTVPTPATYNKVLHVDKSNNISDPFGGPGSHITAPYGFQQGLAFSGDSTSCWSAYALSGQALPTSGCIGFGGFYFGETGTNAGVRGFMAGGSNNFILSTSSNGFTGGGKNNTIAGAYGSASGGYQGTDRQHYAAQVFAGGLFNVQGDAQTELFVWHGTGSTASAFRVDADGSASPTTFTCGVIPNNSAYQLSMRIAAIDHTTPSKSMSWGTWDGLLVRGASAATTAIQMNATPTPLTNGTVTGATIAATADTALGCLNISFTPPTSNTDAWDVVARIETLEVQ